MTPIPRTSTTLLRQIAGAAGHPRWAEFVAKYRPMLEAYAQTHFSGLDADDLIQETLLAVMKALPDYVAREDRKGTFHNYLTGILQHKACDALRDENRQKGLRRRALAELPSAMESGKDAEDWKNTLRDVALDQLMADPKLGAKSKLIFERTVLKGEKPQDVADSLLTTRAVVDQTKKRMMDRLKKLIERLARADGR
jgi:RNA polymerase sigma factor (sigma-70 family)